MRNPAATYRNAWGTPPALFAALHREFDFTVDAAASCTNALLDRFWDELTDGLAQPWAGERVWCNPPYGRGIGAWTAKAAQREASLTVLLVPSRTDTAWWQDHVIGAGAEVRFLRGRLRFVGSHHSAPFASALLVYRERRRPG